MFRLPGNQQDQAAGLLDTQSITYVRKPKSIFVTVDKKMLEDNAGVWKLILEMIKKARDP